MGLPTDEFVGERERLPVELGERDLAGEGEPRGVAGETVTGTEGDSSGGSGMLTGAGAGAGASGSTSGGGSTNLGIGGASSVSGGGSLKTGIGGGAFGSSLGAAGGAGAAVGAGVSTGTAGAASTGAGDLAGSGTGANDSGAGAGGKGGSSGRAGLGAREDGRMLGFFATSCASRISLVSAPIESLLLLIRMSIGAVRFLKGIFLSDSRFLRAIVGGIISSKCFTRSINSTKIFIIKYYTKYEDCASLLVGWRS